jgi:hypothetical protein
VFHRSGWIQEAFAPEGRQITAMGSVTDCGLGGFELLHYGGEIRSAARTLTERRFMGFAAMGAKSKSGQITISQQPGVALHDLRTRRSPLSLAARGSGMDPGLADDGECSGHEQAA